MTSGNGIQTARRLKLTFCTLAAAPWKISHPPKKQPFIFTISVSTLATYLFEASWKLEAGRKRDVFLSPGISVLSKTPIIHVWSAGCCIPSLSLSPLFEIFISPGWSASIQKLARTTDGWLSAGRVLMRRTTKENWVRAAQQSITSGLVNLLAPTVFCAIDSQNTKAWRETFFWHCVGHLRSVLN